MAVVALVRHYQRQIAACDKQIEAVLREISGPDETDDTKARPKALKRGGVNAPEIEDLHHILCKLCGGKDVTVLPAHTRLQSPAIDRGGGHRSERLED